MSTTQKLTKETRRVLEGAFWIQDLQPEVSYGRIHDDHDGTNEGVLSVSIDRQGDAFISIQSRNRGPGRNQFSDMLRFRTSGGGGMSLRVRNALMVLAEAIRLDNEERPAADPSKNPPQKE
jgi:hypothetical protein